MVMYLKVMIVKSSESLQIEIIKHVKLKLRSHQWSQLSNIKHTFRNV